MTGLGRKYWEGLYKHKLAFAQWPKPLFDFLMDKVYGASEQKAYKIGNPVDADEDTMLIFMVRNENPVKPAEPIIGPGE